MPTALITGASRGFGAALTAALADHGWTVIVDARDAEALRAAHPTATSDTSPEAGTIVAIPGDVTHHAHRIDLRSTVDELGGLDLLVLNASTLGPSPLPAVSELDTADLREVLETNVVAQHALLRALLPELRRARGTVVALSSDAAVEPYPTWGAYGASKAALDHLVAILGAEQGDLTVLTFDPGDMRTAMHQAAFPGEDISDRPLPETVVPVLLALLERAPTSGRYRASDELAPSGAGLL
jgi:NAD(P)-dependent dehydrogenase (short-subunit alcohol dehydrogenase family)